MKFLKPKIWIKKDLNDFFKRINPVKIRNIAIAIALIFAVVVAPNIRIVVALSDEAIIEDITFDDIGVEGHYTFSNVTYTTDGTGSDVLGSSAGIGSGLEAINEISFSGRLHTAMGIGVYGPAAGSGAELDSGEQLWTYENLRTKFSPAGRGTTTNGTTDQELFEYNDKEKYGTGDHNFDKDFDTDTTWYNKNVSTAANAFNITADYQSLNKSLTDASVLDIDEYFNNAGDNKEGINDPEYYVEHTSGTTYVVGYENIEKGVINDLRAYLALINGKDYDNIVITNYNFSTAKISYNMSEHYAGEIQDAVDYWMENTDSSDSAIIMTFFGAPILSWGTQSISTLGGSGSKTVVTMLNNFGKSLKTSFVSFGTKLKQFGTSATNWWGQKIQGAKKTATKAYMTIGGKIKSALSGAQKNLAKGANFVVDATKGFGSGVKGLWDGAVHAVTSIAGGITKVLTSPLFLLALVVIALIGVYVFLKRTERL